MWFFITSCLITLLDPNPSFLSSCFSIIHLLLHLYSTLPFLALSPMSFRCLLNTLTLLYVTSFHLISHRFTLFYSSFTPSSHPLLTYHCHYLYLYLFLPALSGGQDLDPTEPKSLDSSGSSWTQTTLQVCYAIMTPLLYHYFYFNHYFSFYSTTSPSTPLLSPLIFYLYLYSYLQQIFNQASPTSLHSTLLPPLLFLSLLFSMNLYDYSKRTRTPNICPLILFIHSSYPFPWRIQTEHVLTSRAFNTGLRTSLPVSNNELCQQFCCLCS